MGCTVRGSNPDKIKRFFSPPKYLDRLWSPPSVPEFLPRPGHIVDHPPPSSTIVKNVWSNTSAPPIRLHGVDKGKFAFILPMFKIMNRNQPFCITVSSSFSGKMPVQYLKLARIRFQLHPLNFIRS
jgi:hypothetical protein